MRHYVLTRSVYGPGWTSEANARRLEITRAVTARLMALLAVDWTWIVALHPDDPLLTARMAVFRDAAPAFIPLMWTPDALERVPWDRKPEADVTVTQLVAGAAYRAPWRSVMEPGDTIQTRLDDDDGLAPDALRRYQRAAAGLTRRTVLLFPYGLRVYGSRYQAVPHRTNAMQSLVTFGDDLLCVYDYGHTRCREVAPVRIVDRQLGWLWVRHQDTISGWRGTRSRLTAGIRELFPIDWPLVEAAA